ncbi:MAG: NAD+ synthase [Dehalococcoidales bacterium]|nr:NAD+ synthase [Dehalococcoidales bacterium]
MVRRLRLGMVQLNTTVGDFAGNAVKIQEAIDRAGALGVDLLAFPELATCGYPPEDLLFKTRFIEENISCRNRIVQYSAGREMVIVLGFVDAQEDLYNAAAIIHNGKLVDVYHKMFLPNYGVFDELRYFRAGSRVPVYTVGGVGIGVNICEDIWYEAGPSTLQAYSGAEIIVNINASPYHYGKSKQRERMLAARATDNVVIIAYNNLVGGQDELVFDGNSMVLDEKGKVMARGRQFAEDLVVVDLDLEGVFRTRLHDPRWRRESLLGSPKSEVVKIVAAETLSAKPRLPLPAQQVEEKGFPGEVYDALVLGTRDYVQKNGFKKVVIGLSGGVDSSLVTTIAVDALGKENVVAVAMPSQYSSAGSLTDAEKLAKNLGIKMLVIPIEKTFHAYLDMLSDTFKGKPVDVTEENLQARIRGNILMALSNKFGWLVLNTGNKSEMATGFTTLYGDLAGGFAVIKDVPKTMEYKLAEYRNTLAGFALIPSTVLTKEPSPELAPGQKTTDVLPLYSVLDPMLVAYVEEDRSVEQIIGMCDNESLAKKMAKMVDRSEYKRRQSPPGVKITSRAFGRDRRLPITNAFREW